MTDGLFTYGTLETVEVPGSGASPKTANDATAKAPLGVLYRHKGNVYRYVKFDNGTDNVAAAANKVAYWLALDPEAGTFTVTCDVSSAIGAGKNLVAGVLGAVVTDAYYTWIQVGGVTDAVLVASVVAGDKLIYGADGAFARNAAGTDLPDVVFAVALETVDPTSLVGSVLLQNLIW